MSARRLKSRFCVCSEDKIKGFLKGSKPKRKVRVETLSENGCGLIALTSDPRLSKKSNLELQLEVEGISVSLEAKLVYFESVDYDGGDANLMGIKFLWPSKRDQKKFEELIEKAHSLGHLQEKKQDIDERRFLLKCLNRSSYER